MLGVKTLALLGLALCQTSLAASPEEWRGRSIYQILTDRFALENGSTTSTCNSELGMYCGGTWRGIMSQLDYVQGMGFDAIWISPVTTQVEGNSRDGSAYHGYWQTDIYSVNSHFGSADDLKQLAAEVHRRGMFFMIDLVVNHYTAISSPSSVDYGAFSPFNKQSYFHDYCKNNYNTGDLGNIETCWGGDEVVPLVDLRTEDDDVASMWNNWVKGFVSDYSIDGLRLDSALEVNPGFWANFGQAAGVYMVGEVDASSPEFVCGYQQYLGGVLNYGLYSALFNAFSSSGGSVGNLASALDSVQKSCSDISILGTFSENHDQARFASKTSDISQAKNLLTFTMLTDGIPIIYQGQEQHYTAVGNNGGTEVPYNREALWFSKYDRDAELYKHIASLNAIRKNAMAHDSSYTTTKTRHVYNDYTNIAVVKGSLVSVMTNVGSTGADYTLSIPTGLGANVQMTQLLTCDTTTTDSSGTLSAALSAGLPSIYYPTSQIGSLCGGSGSKLRRSRLFRAD